MQQQPTPTKKKHNPFRVYDPIFTDCLDGSFDMDHSGRDI